MAIMTIKKGADLEQIRAGLKTKNIIVNQKIDDTHYVVYKKRRKEVFE